MKIFEHKKLLILGANITELLVVRRAKELGIYTIVTDNNSNRSLSPAKFEADEAWDISWSDIDTLVDLCRKNHVDGILAGFSEFRVENQIKLCQRLNLPCYLNLDQLEQTRNKEKFKNLCRLCGVPVVKEYFNIEDVDEYPVIVKPVDRAGSIGIKVAYNKEELQKAVDNAIELSSTNSIVVERFMGDAIKFDVYYLVQNGQIFFVGSNDTIMAPQCRGLEILQEAWIFPSKYENRFLQKVDPAIRKMLKVLGMKDGYITISGFVDKNFNFTIFETGCRLSGELSYKYVEQKYGINYLDMMIEIAFTGGSRNFRLLESKKELIDLQVLFYGVDGVICNRPNNINLIQYPECDYVDYTIYNKIVKNSGTLLKTIGMVFIYGQTPEAIIQNMSILDNLDWTTSEGKSLIYHRLLQKDVIYYFKNA